MHIFTIKSRQEFIDIQNTCLNSLKSNNIILLYKKITDKEIEKNKVKNFIKFGICVSKKISKKAVVRNKIKRLLRESFRKLVKENNNLIQNNYKYEIIAKKNILQSNFKEIYEDLVFLIKKINTSTDNSFIL